jgi:hypothetical protein
VRERRQRARTRQELNVSYRMVGESSVDLTRDISEGGLFLDCERPLPLGTRLELFLPDPDDPDATIRVEAVVVRVVWGGRRGGRPVAPGMAVEFAATDDDARALIARWTS